VSVRYQLKGGTLQAEVSLPAGVEGIFRWAGREYPLHGGRNELKARN